MKNITPQNANNTAYEQAQEWFIRLQAEPNNQQLLSQFQNWLDQAEENEQLYLETCLLWQDMGTASEQITSSKYSEIPLEQSFSQLHFASTPPQPNKVFSKRRVMSVLSLTTVLVLIALLAPRHIWYAPDYFTAVGEQQTIRLEDGSTLHLNSQSAVNINYSEDFRDIELLYGEAFFEVAKHQMRPFRVTSGNVTARAVGTAFNVRQLEHKVQTTLTEGKLKVSFSGPSQKKANNDVMLKAGQAVTFTERGATILSEGHSLYLPDWKRHILRLDDVPLVDVVALLNRQYATHLLLLNTDRATENMTGVIPLGDLDLTLKMLNKSLHLEATGVLHQVMILH